jgi:serine/threonine protein kinase
MVMETDSAKPAGSRPDATDHASREDASRRPSDQETIASSSSSFRGLIGGIAGSTTGSSSIDDLELGASEAGQSPGVGQSFGRYQIRKILGSGSMGSVFLAHDSQLDRNVALKVPRFDYDSKGDLSQRLFREARAAATLNHPNICPIYDVSEHAGTCFIAMGFVKGEPLSAYIASKKRQPAREAAKVVRKIALALQEAHAHGILHRDLKPTNIMIDKRGEPIVMDFGVACWFEDQTQTRLTQQGSIVGTPAYMSPEQIEGRIKIGPTSDVYSLGVLLYQILTGRCAFEGTVLNVISQVLHQPPPPATNFRPDLSPELVAVIDRAMCKNPNERFPSMLDFAKALTAFVNGPSRGESPRKSFSEVETIEFDNPKAPRSAYSTAPPILPALPRRTGRPRPQAKKRRNWLPVAVFGGGVTVLLLVGGFIGALLTSGRRNAELSANGQSASSPADVLRKVKPHEPSLAAVQAPVAPTLVTSASVLTVQPISVPNPMTATRGALSHTITQSSASTVPLGAAVGPGDSTIAGSTYTAGTVGSGESRGACFERRTEPCIRRWCDNH